LIEGKGGRHSRIFPQNLIHNRHFNWKSEKTRSTPTWNRQSNDILCISNQLQGKCPIQCSRYRRRFELRFIVGCQSWRWYHWIIIGTRLLSEWKLIIDRYRGLDWFGDDRGEVKRMDEENEDMHFWGKEDEGEGLTTPRPNLLKVGKENRGATTFPKRWKGAF